MAQSILSHLQYETFIAPGAYFHLETDWFTTDQEIQSIIIDQDNIFSKILSLYPEGFVLYLEQTPEGSIYRTNYPLYLKEGSDSYNVDWTVKKRTSTN